MSSSTLRLLKYFGENRSSRYCDSNAINFMSTAFDALTSLAIASANKLDGGVATFANHGAWILAQQGGAAEAKTFVVSPSPREIRVTFADAKFRDAIDIESCVAELASTELTVKQLIDFVNEIVDERVTSFLSPTVGTQYVFEMKVARSDMSSRVTQYINNTPDSVMKMQRIVGASKSLQFTKQPFRSNKTFSSLFGDEIRELERRVRFFLDNSDWYRTKGIPYQLGIMLSGECGTGKSSAIRAIANLTHRHIVNVNISNVCTNTQLRHLFFSNDLSVSETESASDSDNTCMHVPVHQRLFVLEEIDAVGAGDLLHDRTKKTQQDKAALPDEISLGEILQVFDGNVEAPGRIIIVTTNYPEKLDRAFMRPGRIDMHIKFGMASRRATAELVESLLDVKLSDEQVERLPHRKLSPAHVSEMVLRQRMLLAPQTMDETALLGNVLEQLFGKSE